MPRAHGYIRVSTVEQAEEGYSLAAQEGSLREHCERQGWDLVRIYADEGISAKDMRRPGLQSLLANLSKSDIILVWKLDRLSRSVGDTEAIFKSLDKLSASLVSVTEPHLSTVGASGVLVRQITAVFAEHYRRSLGENVRHGMMQLVRQGKWYGGQVPYGYDALDGKLVPNDYADVVRRIYRDYVSGYGTRSIAVRLNTDGIRTRLGTQWSDFTVSYILRQPIYYGNLAYGKRRGKRIDVTGDHQAIISEELWQQVQSVMFRRKTLPSRTAGGRYPLTGIAVCGLCGSGISGVIYASNKRMYRCGRRQHRGTCAMPYQSADQLEAVFVERIAELADMDKLAQIIPLQLPDADTDALKRRLADVERRISRLEAAWDAGAFEPQEYADKRKPLRAERQELHEQLATQAGSNLAVRVHQAAATIPVVWEDATAEERKELAHSLGLRVVIMANYGLELHK